MCTCGGCDPYARAVGMVCIGACGVFVAYMCVVWGGGGVYVCGVVWVGGAGGGSGRWGGRVSGRDWWVW